MILVDRYVVVADIVVYETSENNLIAELPTLIPYQQFLSR